MGRILTVCFVFLTAISASAGAFSEIDLIVRDAVVAAYSDEITPDKDIWDLDLVENYKMDCLVMVTGLAMKPNPKAQNPTPARFWVCISKSSEGSLEALFIGDQDLLQESQAPTKNFRPE